MIARQDLGRRRAGLIAPLIALAACGGGEGDGGGIDVSRLQYNPCPAARQVGGFEVTLGDGFTAVQGQVFDVVTPSRVPDVITTLGACSWVRAPMLVCNPACATGRLCAPNNACIAAPVARDIGTIAVDGLAAAVSMTPRPPAYFYSFTGALPHPGFAPGAGIRLSAPGLALLGWGIEPLAVGAATIAVRAGADVPLTWTPPSRSGPVKVEISLNVNGHGLVGSHVECTADDTGSFTIPEPLVTSLVADGLSGFPTLTVRRTTTDSAEVGAGCVELDVKSQVTLDVQIPGLRSCDGDEDCTAPQTCRPDLTCG